MDKFADLPYEARTANGIRYIPTYTNAVLSCEVINVKDLETQVLTIANVVEAKVLSKAPGCSGEFFADGRGRGWLRRMSSVQAAASSLITFQCAHWRELPPLGEAQAVDKT